MSLQVDRFLTDSGAHFTETAPRPPVPGEENELQSNGGTSTRSSSSHKSHVSGKSHTSNKSARSDVSHHSPAATPRRSNLDKSSSGHELRRKLGGGGSGDVEEAPLGFEPEGSAASSPAFHENTTPPYLKWAEKIEHLLDDGEGVRLFKHFLDHEHSSSPLDFWFACKGLKDGVQPDDASKIQSLVKLIYKKYIKCDQLKLAGDVKKTITDRLKKEHYDQGIFDEAQTTIKNRMRNDTYPLFLKSDVYVTYVQQGGDSPKTTSNTSSGSNSVRPMSGPLPTVHEDEVLKPEDLRRAKDTTVLPLTHAGLAATYSSRAASNSFAIPEGFPVHSKHHSRSTNMTYREHSSYAPVSQWESEVQSLSSDALTESDTMSLTDSSVDGREVRGSRPWKKKQKQIRCNANINKHTGLNQPLIPRTDRVLKDRNIAETNPPKFAAMLIEKLEVVKTKQEEPERMREFINTLEIAESRDVPAATIVKPLPPPPLNVTATTMAPSMNSSLSMLMASVMPQEEDNAQSILEEHVSRIWDSSTGETPSLSPGRHSPDRTRAAPPFAAKAAPAMPSLKRPSATAPVTVAATAVNKDHLLSLKSFDSGMGEDKSVFVDADSHHRHIHHYHHHHHHILKDKVRPSTTTPLHHMISAPALGSYNAPRTGKRSSTAATKRMSDANSNIDSGIYDLPVTNVPNLHDPASEKVLAWMLENDKVSTGTAQYSTDNSDKASSSHKRSHKSGSSSSQHKSSKKPVASTSFESGRSASLDRREIQPAQPIAQDMSMPPLTPPNPTMQLEEVRRRLSDVHVTKSKSFTANMGKEKTSRGLPSAVGGATGTIPPRTLPTRYIPPHQQQLPLDLSTAEEQQIERSRAGFRRQGSSVPVTPTTTTSGAPAPDVTVVGYYFCSEPIPYRSTLTGTNITLAQFRELLTKKGNYRYFFKRPSDEFDSGVVFEEVSNDNEVLPLCDGKIICKVDKVE